MAFIKRSKHWYQHVSDVEENCMPNVILLSKGKSSHSHTIQMFFLLKQVETETHTLPTWPLSAATPKYFHRETKMANQMPELSSQSYKLLISSTTTFLLGTICIHHWHRFLHQLNSVYTIITCSIELNNSHASVILLRSLDLAGKQKAKQCVLYSL